MISERTPSITTSTPRRTLRPWVFDLLLVYVLLVGAFFRLVGSTWGEYQYLHPDERFLIWVGSDISPVNSLSEYFNTPESSLNPHNRGHGFYVYGTLPMFITRYIVEWIYGHSGFVEMTNVGRPLSAAADLLVVLLVYLVATRLFDRRVGILAALFSAAAVMHIQQSHFFTMDTFINLFTFLAFYFAVRVSLGDGEWETKVRQPAKSVELLDNPATAVAGDESIALQTKPKAAVTLKEFTSHPYFWLSLGFGVALGMGVASKLNAAPMAFALPAAFLIRLYAIPENERKTWATRALGYLVLAAVVSLLVFRIFQPYAFSGPGFFGLKLNPQWLANLRDLRAQGTGDVDFPPAMQWARRPVWFAWQNMVLWGMGLPLGILAWAGFLWAGWRILKGQWSRFLLMWVWTAFYFTWQSLIFNPSMRYQLPVYPTLVIFAAWAVVELWDSGKKRAGVKSRFVHWKSILAAFIACLVAAGSLTWAYAFSSIYTRPITRVEASRWILANIPGPINLQIETPNETTNQPLPFPYDHQIILNQPYFISFDSRESGLLREITLPHVLDRRAASGLFSLNFMATTTLAGEDTPLTLEILEINPELRGSPAGEDYISFLKAPFQVVADQEYNLSFSLTPGQPPVDLCGEIILYIQTPVELIEATLPSQDPCILQAGVPMRLSFTPEQSGSVVEIYFTRLVEKLEAPSVQTFQASISPVGEEHLVTTAMLTSQFLPDQSGAGSGYSFVFDQPLRLEEGRHYRLALSLQSESGALQLKGAGIANEGEWDDGLPLRMDGYDPFGGIYPLGLNFNMYWDDTPEKLQRFTRILNEADYIIITSSRQWGSLPRIPERFPMTTVYYRNLIGCPIQRSIEWCYNEAQPGMFQGKLGYELVKTFQSNPRLGPWSINDQPSEEAFTVYDHPKVFVFRKTEAYDPEQVSAILGAVDFTQVVRIPPGRAGSFPANLLLPEERLVGQRLGGTWSELFNTQALHNRFQVLGVVVWYLSLTLLGLLTYPVLRLALPGLSDRGYPLARTAGVLILSYLVWLAGSLRIPSSRSTISILLLLMLLGGVALAYRQRGELLQEWRQKRKYFLIIEGLTLAFFLAFLLVRLGNPDLWHPWKGGEKPMDFSYFNALLRSTTYPPYDPWFEGGYLNYYYYGFMFVGVLVKWLGIVPTFAYNLILPALFSMVAMGAFSIAWNLYAWRASSESGMVASQQKLPTPFTAGLLGSILMVVLGNLGTLRMIFRGYQILADPTMAAEGASTIARWIATLQGLGRALSGTPLLYSIGDWYWIPSRVMPPNDNAITEFPLFTFLYADPHAHLIALPIALLALAWAVSVVLGQARWKGFLAGALGFLLGGLAIGALRPTNTWDFPTYLALGVVALGYAVWRYLEVGDRSFWNPALLNPLRGLPAESWRLIVATASIGLLVALANLLYYPYSQWYGQGYTAIEFWKGPVTPFWSYITHWGLFLFVIFTWLIWETRHWMANTPVSALRKLTPFRDLILLLAVILFVVILLLAVKLPTATESAAPGNLPFGRGVSVAWITLPLVAWCGILLLRPSLPESKRVALFLVGTGLVITLLVEVIVLRGDIGRQNTVFKLYLQVWTLFAVSAAAALGWVMASLREWTIRWRTVFQVVLVSLIVSAALFTLLGTSAKIKDRMTTQVPLTLDGMAYMMHSVYDESGIVMDLSQDYNAIRWMQENVSGSPVILEANSGRLYRWYTRFTIYTGLPGVVGWEWHQQQQRALTPSDWVSRRLWETNDFYITTDLEVVNSFLRKYHISYIVLGQLERATYPGPGLDKFEALEGEYWREVYRAADTIIYQVIEQ